jgi:choline dehydrogenase-like flavoprotein
VIALPVHDADAIVVGAGLSGSWVAKELTSGGMNVMLIDAGRWGAAAGSDIFDLA